MVSASPAKKESDPLPDFKKMIFPNGEDPPRDLVMKYSVLVPAEIR
jgi:hypothetical protein